jgi:hypothetical protein
MYMCTQFPLVLHGAQLARIGAVCSLISDDGLALSPSLNPSAYAKTTLEVVALKIFLVFAAESRVIVSRARVQPVVKPCNN